MSEKRVSGGRTGSLRPALVAFGLSSAAGALRCGKETPVAKWRMKDLHPYAQAIYKHARAKPEAVEEHPWDDTVFKVRKKVFIFLGNPPGRTLGVKVPPEDLEGLLSLPFVERSPYIGRYGWVSVTVEDDEGLELALELIDDSYDMRAPKALRSGQDLSEGRGRARSSA